MSTPSSAATCSAVVEIGSMWPGGYQATVSVRNVGAATSPWTVAWTLPAGTTLTSGWNAVVEQHGTTVTASAPSWNATLSAGSTLSIGFNADGMPNPPPGGVTLNGVPCQA
jgi:endoglucanase